MGDPPGETGALANRPGPLRVPLAAGALERVYRAVVARRNARFDRGDGVERLPLPVISVGNLSVGGTGKTPMVMHVLRVLLEAGGRPCVAMRGYTRGGQGPGHDPDETDSYRRAFPGVPVVARPDRAAGVRELLAALPERERPDCAVLDDGFQHRRIARDLDLVLVDATPDRSPLADRCLPAGWLREPVESLRRADAVVLTHAELADDASLAALEGGIARHHGRPPIAVTRHAWIGLKEGPTARGEERMLPLDVLIGARVVGLCAIGHPEAFLRSLRLTARGPGGEPARVTPMVLPDHHPLGEGAVARLIALARAERAAFIVVTDKDWSKLRRVDPARWPCPVVRPELALGFDRGREALEGLILGAVGGAGRGESLPSPSSRAERS